MPNLDKITFNTKVKKVSDFTTSTGCQGIHFNQLTQMEKLRGGHLTRVHILKNLYNSAMFN